MANEDIIKFPIDIQLTDKDGNPIEIQVQRPEILTETWHKSKKELPPSSYEENE